MDGTQDIAPSRYDEDFIAWAKAQAAAIRARNFGAVDWDHVAEEMESLGVSERNELENRIVTIIEHLLKLDHGRVREPERKWRATILTQQDDLEHVIAKMPSLRRMVSESIVAGYPRARKRTLRSLAIYEPGTDYDDLLPVACPYSVDDVLGE